MTRLLAAFAFAVSAAALAQTPAAPSPPSQFRFPVTPAKLALTTPAFADGGIIPEKYAFPTPDAKPVSPKFTWTGAPEGTVSFVMLMRDEEFPPNRRFAPWYHWILFNIPGTAAGLPEGLPTDKQLADGGVQPQNGRRVGYVGPGAPAAGLRHHYTFTLYALDTKLDLGSEATIEEIGKAMEGHVLDKGFYVGLYHKPQ